jgi:hypothetical protein
MLNWREDPADKLVACLAGVPGWDLTWRVGREWRWCLEIVRVCWTGESWIEEYRGCWIWILERWRRLNDDMCRILILGI